MSKFTDADKAACARREVGMRQKVYPRRVANGVMHQVEAEREIAIMQEIADEYDEKGRLPL